MDEYNYTLDCPACEVHVEAKVFEEDELPVFCPMCGEDVNEEWTEED